MPLNNVLLTLPKRRGTPGHSGHGGAPGFCQEAGRRGKLSKTPYQEKNPFPFKYFSMTQRPGKVNHLGSASVNNSGGLGTQGPGHGLT